MIAIDGGGTRTRCAAYTLDGRQLATGSGGPSNHLSAGKSRALESLQIAISQTLQSCNAGIDDVRLVSAGFAGVDYDRTGASDMEALLSEAGYQRAFIQGDMVTAHAGALNGQPGVIAIAGTGSVYFGTSPDGSCLKLGGFGYAFGDEGAGYWIGIESLRAASKAYDQRAAPTRLVAALCQVLNLKDFSQILQLFYSESMQPSQVAKLSLTVEAVAEGGDAVALQILEQAGRELAIGTVTLIRRLKYSVECVVSYYGAILQECPIVLEAFKHHIVLSLPTTRIEEPVFDALYGAYLLGRREIESQEKRGK